MTMDGRTLRKGTVAAGFGLMVSLLLSLPMATPGFATTPESIPEPANAVAVPLQDQVRNVMKRASRFMTGTVSYQGGYLWYYLPDFSRRWGEMEATATMAWVQPPGTASMGHLYLDAFHATGDGFYYRAAEQVAGALIRGQHPSGGWNYMFDLAGEASLKHWYDTIGRNGWRLEEFHHYYGNATFDDGGTFEASVFLLRLYLEKHDDRYLQPLLRAVAFVLDSQYDIGGWPQRYPPAGDYTPHGHDDYSRYITFNDDVASKNIRFLLMCHQTLDDPALHRRLREAIERGMQAFVKLQLPPPQPGWALQYSADLKPAAARSYEPASVSVSATADNIGLLLDFYEMTGDGRYIARLGEALDWLDSVRLPDALIHDGRTHPRMVELGSNRPLFVHRRGSNAVNGEYYTDYNPAFLVPHYPSAGRVDTATLRRRYNALKALPADQLPTRPWLNQLEHQPLSRYFVDGAHLARIPGTDNEPLTTLVTASEVRQRLAGLNEQGYWPSDFRYYTNPYRGPGAPIPAEGDYRTSWVGDATDTSPWFPEQPTRGIAIRTFLGNMARLMAFLEQQRSGEQDQ